MKLKGFDMSETLSLSDLPRTLREMTCKRVTYQRLYRLVVDGDLAAEKNSSGHWRIKRDDLPDIAAKLTQGD
jgi:hypothetical protein